MFDCIYDRKKRHYYYYNGVLSLLSITIIIVDKRRLGRGTQRVQFEASRDNNNNNKFIRESRSCCQIITVTIAEFETEFIWEPKMKKDEQITQKMKKEKPDESRRVCLWWNMEPVGWMNWQLINYYIQRPEPKPFNDEQTKSNNKSIPLNIVWY